jgi:hypothetical protein
MEEAQLIAVLDSMQTSLSRHIADNNRKFYDIDATLTSLQDSQGTEMTEGMQDTVKINNTATDPNAALMMALAGNRNNDGMFGGGGGLLSGLVLASLLRGNGFLGGAGGAGMTDITQPPANMSIMSTLGDIKQAVAVGTAQMETSQALQSSTIQSQLSGIAAALTNTVGGVKDSVNQNTVALMQLINGVNQNINNDGDKTRAILVAQNTENLNRQLATSQAEVIELRNDLRSDQRARANEINVTQNVNQMQQQQQQQRQLSDLQNLVMDALQSIRATNQAINIGGGTQTANPANTNTNVRA